MERGIIRTANDLIAMLSVCDNEDFVDMIADAVKHVEF